jgi:hypothetical protein
MLSLHDDFLLTLFQWVSWHDLFSIYLTCRRFKSLYDNNRLAILSKRDERMTFKFNILAANGFPTSFVLTEGTFRFCHPSRIDIALYLTQLGDQDALLAALETGADPDGSSMWTPVDVAIKTKRADLLDILVSHGASLEHILSWDLHVSLVPANISVLKVLLKHGMDPNIEYGDMGWGSSIPLVSYYLDMEERGLENGKECVRALVAAGLDRNVSRWLAGPIFDGVNHRIEDYL